MENKIEKTENILIITDSYGDELHIDKEYISAHNGVVEIYPNGASAIVDFLTENFDLKPNGK